MTSIDLSKLWFSGHFDPPIGNVWRTMNKAERINGVEYYLREWGMPSRPAADEEWKSRLLHTAIKDNKLLAVQLLIELRADVNYKFRGTRTPLHAAAFRKDPHFVKILLEHGANPLSHDDKGQMPLQQAVLNGFEETSAALILGGADVNAKFDEGIAASKTPLMLAYGLYIPKADQELPSWIIHLLLSNSADVAMKDKNGMSAIHYAARSRDFCVIKQVIDAGADCKPIDNSGWNVIHLFALGRKYFDTYDFSSTRATDNSLTNNTKRSFDLLAQHCAHNALSQSTELDFPANQDINTRRYGGCVHTPMSLAIDRGDWELFEALEQSGAKMRTTCPLDALLEVTIINLQPAVVQFLIQQGATLLPNTRCLRELSPVGRTTRLNALDYIKLESILTDIVPLGLNTPPTIRERTILHEAAGGTDSGNLTRVLLDAGADPYKEDGGGLDAFLHACLGGNLETLRCLLARGPHKREGHWTKVCICQTYQTMPMQQTWCVPPSNKSELLT